VAESEVAGAGAAGGTTTMQTPEQVVATALRALDRRTTPPSVVSGGLNRVSSNLTRFFPRRAALEVVARVTSSR
jgi:hypothetical protein